MVASEWNDPHNGADDTKEFREWQEKQPPTPADLAALADTLEKGTDHVSILDLRMAARCVKDKAEELWRDEKPRMLTCPTCKKKGFDRTAIWYPFSTEAKCKCNKCGAWATAPEWSDATALAAVEEVR